MKAPENYYEAPQEGPAQPASEHLPETFTGKLSLALRMYFGNFFLISAIVLTVWIPLNFVTDAILSQGQDPEDVSRSLRINNLAEGIFGPIVAGAVIWVIRQRVSARPVGYGRAMRAGFRSWGAIFAARFVAGFFILFGFIALIIPGIRFCVYYALMDQVAAVENPGYTRSRHRSWELVRGQAWEVLLVISLNFFLVILAIIGESVLEAYDMYRILASRGGNLAATCVIDIVSAFPTCLLTVYYLEAAARKHPDETGLDWTQSRHKSEAEIGPGESL